MARYSCCGHDFGTAEAYGEHRKLIHGESKVAPPDRPGFWRRVLALLRGGR